jgi:uncharacterized Zn finger protein
MKSLSETSFKTLAGDAAYASGLDYYNDGRVIELNINDTNIRAKVNGSETYSVTLIHTSKIFEGSCSCPASDHFDFCKHCVAASLTYYYQTQINLEMADDASSDPVDLYLNTFTKPQLVEELLKLIKRDPTQYDHWLLRAELASGNLSSKDLRKRITKAIPYKPSGIWRSQEVAQYFANAEMAIEALEPAVLGLAASEAMKLIVYSIERLEKTMETIDDSSGYRQALEKTFKHWFVSMFDSHEWQSKERSALMCELMLSEKFSYEVLNLPLDVEHILSADDQQNIIANIAKSWAGLTPPEKDKLHNDSLYKRLERILLADARALNNIDRELDILAKGAIDTDRCLNLVSLCIVHQRLAEANKWLEYASQVQTLRPYDVAAIETHQIELWIAEKEFNKAAEAQWARFEESEEFEDLKSVVSTASHYHQERHYVQEGIRYLSSKIEPKKDSPRNRQRVENLVNVYLHYNIVDEATALVLQHKVHPGSLMAVANAAPVISDKVCRVIERAASNLINLGSNETYERANWFLKKLYSKANSKDRAAIKTVIEYIYNQPEIKRKTNFIKGLKANFDFI